MKDLKAMKKNDLIQLVVEAQESSPRMSCSVKKRQISPTCSDENCCDTITFPALKSFISTAIMELKEELTLDFEQRLSALSSEVVSLRNELASLKMEAGTNNEGLKAEVLSEIRDQESRKCNLIIFGAQEPQSSSSSEAKIEDSQYLADLGAALGLAAGVTQFSLRSHFRLGRKRPHQTHPRPLKLIFNSQIIRNEYLRAAPNLRKAPLSDKYSGIFLKPDLTPREQESEKKLRFEFRRRRRDGERVVLRRGQIVPESSPMHGDGK